MDRVKTEQLTGAQIVVRCLQEEGVDYVFGYPGGAVLFIYDELFKQDKVRHVLVRHEQGAAHAADGYSRASTKVGVCLVTSGPGVTNAVTGIATAYMDSIPMVILSGQVPTPAIGLDAFQEVDAVGITRPCVKHNFLVKNVRELAGTIKKAFYLAKTGRPGPVFVNLLLADEVNRAPAKTQAALLEAMQERTVTVDGRSHPLPAVFTVFATQNPIEFEGTYPLPEAELDRFMLKISLGYPPEDTERGILHRYLEGFEADLPETYGIATLMDGDGLLALRGKVDGVRVEPRLVAYITSIVRATREAASLTLGASPRAGVSLLKAARGSAVLDGRDYAIPDDVKALAAPALRHRISVAPELELEGVTADAALKAILEQIEAPTT